MPLLVNQLIVPYDHFTLSSNQRCDLLAIRSLTVPWSSEKVNDL